MTESLPLDSGTMPDAAALPGARELAMSAAWHGGLARELHTVSGEAVTVVFRGNWSHGVGPDFADAMIQVGERPIQSGAVEIHRAASDWHRHGHHTDPRYNAVILHVVSRLDTAETRREDGAIVPTVVLDVPDADLFRIDQELPEIWSRLGQSICAGDLASREPARLRSAILRLGDLRFSERVTAYEGELSVELLPSVLARGLFDAFGYSQNREPMRLLADEVISAGILEGLATSRREQRLANAQAALFGLGGFLPQAPADAHAARLSSDDIAAIEDIWRTNRQSWGQAAIPPTMWTRLRTRPANHPAARLASLGHLLANTGGDPGGPLIDCLRSGSDPVAALRSLSGGGLGAGRAIAIIASVVLPVAMAWARHTDDNELEDAVATAWSALPRSEWSRPARRALNQAVGDAPLGPLGERAIQGLLHLDRRLCTPRRCYECPVAAEVIRDRLRQRLDNS